MTTASYTTSSQPPLGASPLDALTFRLLKAAALGDWQAIRSLYDESFRGALNPMRLSGAHGENRAPARLWFEAWDDVLSTFVFCEGGEVQFVREIMLPQRGGFPMGLLLLNGFWLQRAGTELPDDAVALPAGFASLPLEAQARALGAALFRAHARCPFDYEAVASELHPRLLPALELWFLGGYLANPLASIDPLVCENRSQAVDGFCDFHRNRELVLPPLMIFGASAFAATGFAKDPRDFLETLSERLLTPTLTRARRKGSRSGWKRKSLASNKLGLVLSVWSESAAVYRCMNPMVRGMKRAGALGIQLGAGTQPDPSALAPAWRDATLHAACDGTLPELARGANRIRSLRLDFLMYPEVGLSGTRWLATQRLARVQAAGYGHPVTTGCSAIDYFVGGAAIERGGRGYSERLVLLPGLGVASEPPLEPSQPRRRPTNERDFVMLTLASYNKMNQPLLEAWASVVREAGANARLKIAAGLPPAHCHGLVEELTPFFPDGRVELMSKMPRQECVDLLTEADVYLDSFPFSGYNSVVEALASGCPVVTLEGKHAYGRFAAGALRLLNLPDWLIANSPAEYVAAVVRLMREPALREELREQLTRDQVVAALCSDDVADHFDAAVAWMREQGPRNPGPPVLIEAGESPRVVL